MDYKPIRNIYDLGIKVLIKNRKNKGVTQNYTSKDKKLHVSHHEWDDLMDIFYDDKLVFRSNLGRVKRLVMGDWIVKLRSEVEGITKRSRK